GRHPLPRRAADDDGRGRGRGHGPGGADARRGGACPVTGSHRDAGYHVWAVAGLPEVRKGDDLARLIADAAPDLADGDVLLVTSKIVSKAEGRVVEAADREAAIDAETVRVVARRRAALAPARARAAPAGPGRRGLPPAAPPGPGVRPRRPARARSRRGGAAPRAPARGRAPAALLPAPRPASRRHQPGAANHHA